MSIEARTWAKKIVVGNPTAKAVLCAIADYADTDGVAWPSQAALAEDTEFSERAVRTAIQLLERKGLLSTKKRHRKDGSRKSDLLTLALGQSSNRHDVPVGDNQPAPATGCPTGTSFQTNRHDVPNQPAPAAGLTSFEPSLNHQKNRQQNSSEAVASGTPTELDVPFSPKDLLWRDGVLTLQGLGLAEQTAKRFIGKLMRDTAGDAGHISWAINEARRAETGDPIPYVSRLLTNTPTSNRARPPPREAKSGITDLLRDLEGISHDTQPADDLTDLRNRRLTLGSHHRTAAERDGMGGPGPILDLKPIRSDR